MDAISVLLIDANQVFLRIATQILQDHYYDTLTVVGISPGNDDVIRQAQHLKPQVILLGLGQYTLTALRLIPRLRTGLPAVKIIVLGSLDIDIYRQAALEAGADGFVAKVAINSALLPTIRHVMTTPQPGSQNMPAGEDLSGLGDKLYLGD